MTENNEGKYDNSNALAHAKLYLEDPDKAQFIYPWGDDRGVETLLLTTTGRKSGQTRSTPLIYKKIGDFYAVVASLGGAPRHPSWYLNLVATPECQIQVGRAQMTAKARTAPDRERENVWRALVELFPEYEKMQARTQRRIPVVVIEPTGALTRDSTSPGQ